jgi:hypothetical protein
MIVASIIHFLGCHPKGEVAKGNLSTIELLEDRHKFLRALCHRMLLPRIQKSRYPAYTVTRSFQA